jgi:hypothetical protein
VDAMTETTPTLVGPVLLVYQLTILEIVLVLVVHLDHVMIQQIVIKVNFVQRQSENVIRPEHVQQSKLSVQIYLIQCVDVMGEITPALVGLVLLVYQFLTMEIVLDLVLVLVVHLNHVMTQQIVTKVNTVQSQWENVNKLDPAKQKK